MATKTFDGRTLILVLENGLNEKMDPIFVRKSINTVREAATSEDILAVGNKLAKLYQNSLYNVCVDEDYIIQQ